MANRYPVAIPSSAGPSRYEWERGGRGDGAGPPGMGPPPALEPVASPVPGGEAVFEVLHPDIRIVERLFRKQPEESWVSSAVSSSRPIVFTIGEFQVPNGQMLFLKDYEFSVYRLSGFEAGDWIKLDNGRLAGSIGFDVLINDSRLADLFFELEPSVIDVTGGVGRFTTQSFATGAGPGTSLLPLRPEVQGPRDSAFTFVCDEQQVVKLRCTLWRPLGIAPAAIEGRMAGHLMHRQAGEAIMQRVRPR